ncbi:MAG: DUF401 family protein [Spirochaetes bacterium]|nr:DUF401 family protein [Spirochaetota bacterium]
MRVMQGELAAWGLPVLALVMVLPFIAGVTSGIAVGFVGASFPFIAALLPSGVPLHERLALEVLAYGFGYMGLILSPIHACLIVSCSHFKTRVGDALLRLLPATALVMLGTLAWYALLQYALR